MKKTVARFTCVEVAQRQNDTRVVTFDANTSASNDWSRFTPSGKLNITVTNPACEFVVGQNYLLTLEPE